MKNRNSIAFMKKWYVVSALVSDTGIEMHQSQLLHLIQNLTQDRQNLDTCCRIQILPKATGHFIQLFSNVLCNTSNYSVGHNKK